MKIAPMFNRAFTIVELMIIVAVIAILVGATTFGYGNWQESVAKKAVQSDLRMAASAMESAKNFGDGYPSSIPSTFRASPNVTITRASGSLTSFCINGVHNTKTNVKFYINSNSGDSPVAGTC